MAVGVTVTVVALGGALYLAMSGKSAPTRKAPKISLIAAAPPPPPPPPKEEKRPEPPKQPDEIKEVQQAPPKEAPPAPASQDLKMDGPAGDGPSAFSSGTITNEDLSKVGKGDGGGGGDEGQGLFNPHTNYATLLKGELQRYLARNKDLRPKVYRIQVHVWVDGSGHLTRHEIVGSTGDTDLDAALGAALAGMGAFSDAPPKSMPMPIRLRLQASGRG